MTDRRNIQKDESRTSKALWYFYWLFILLSIFLIGWIIYLKLYWPYPGTESYFRPKTVENVIKPIRGTIVDHNGKILAITNPQYNIYMDCAVLKAAYADDPEKESEWKDKAAKLAERLPEVLAKDGRDAKYYRDLILNGRKNNLRYVPITKNIDHYTYLTLQELPLFEEGKYRGGIIADTLDPRKYPYEGLARSVIGYVREQEDINKARRRGIESKFDYELHGTPGLEWLRETDNRGKIHDADSSTIPVINGNDIRSTIDIDLQDIADNALRKRIEDQEDIDGGCLILMEVETGAIRAMVNLTRGRNGKMGEHYNLAIARSGEPGSIIKTATLMTLLEDKKVSLDTKIKTNNGKMENVNDDETIQKYERENNTDRISVLDGFKLSSNYVFRYLVKEHYGKNPKEYLRKFYTYNIAGRYEFELDGMAYGIVPDPDARRWSSTDLIQSAIGYSVQTTPLHMVTFYNGVANKGKMMKPYVVESIERDGKVLVEFEPQVLNGAICSEATADTLVRALKTVTAEGTGSKVKNAKCEIAGKTGTAWIALDSKYTDGKGGKYIDEEGRKQYQASFVGFFPADEPKYTAIVTIYSSPTKASIYGGNIPALTIKEMVDKIYALDSRWGENVETVGEMPQIETPELVMERGTNTPVPSVIGCGLKDALYIIENSGYKCQYSGIGHVVSQNPKAGEALTEGGVINIILK